MTKVQQRMKKTKNPISPERAKALALNAKNSKERRREASFAEKVKGIGGHLVPYPLEFSANQIDEIVNAAGGLPAADDGDIDQQKKALLGEKLAVLYQNLLMKRFSQSLPPASSGRKRFARVERLCSQLLETLEIQDDDPLSMPFEISALIYPAANRYALKVGGYADFPPQDSSFRGREKCRQVIEGIALMRKWAADVNQHAQNVIAKHKSEGKPHHSSDEAMHEFFVGVNAIWKDCFGKTLGMSVGKDDGTVSGPYLKFIKVIFSNMRRNITPEMNQSDPKLIKDLTSSAPAIRKRFRNTQNSTTDNKTNPEDNCVKTPNNYAASNSWADGLVNSKKI